jgi:hypothetical protein
MATKKTARDIPVYVYVEYYRATNDEVRQLQRFLKSAEGITGIGRVAQKAAGGVELGHLFNVWIMPVLVSYAGNKVLKFVEDRTKEWFKKNGRKEQFITLKLSTPNTRKRRVGTGRPRRGDRY